MRKRALPDLNDPAIMRLILRLALPSVAGLSINAINQVVDAFFVSQYALSAMAGVTLSIPCFMLVGAIGHGLGLTASTEIGRALGRDNVHDAARSASLTLALAIGFGVSVAILITLFHGPILHLLGARNEVFTEASIYMRILGACSVLVLLQIVCDFIAIGEGNSRFSMYTLLGSFGLNMVLDPILIFGFELGVAGAAWATIISQIAALCAYVYYFKKRLGRIHPDVGALHALSWRKALVPFGKLGIPASTTTILASICFAALMQAATRHGNEEELAGLAISLRIVLLAILPIIGFCLGSQPILSYAAGAGNQARFEAVFKGILLYCAGFSITCAVIAFLFGDWLIAAFVSKAELITFGAHLLDILAIQVAFVGIYQPMVSRFQAAHNARCAAIVSMAPQGYIQLPLALFLPMAFGLDGIVMAPALAAGLTALIAVSLTFSDRKTLLIKELSS
ncbi:MATE family efflux transporter [Thalassospira sp. ER-Se-21-Dark]|uniref:MATE family efflux transporter n=1 Tax=Thalassospira sp. ER-Se-21-Dark TaxID=2585190 RepID=UPI001B30704D|nr:MATE family efflux transporter [Thalassospira sp. ER-Se-21-Dark]MBP3124745.1 MATE family efflux transporter [Thalassospira sp. ER-Se-21-Dark]